MSFTQEEFEVLYSRKSLMKQFRRAIIEQFDDKLGNWALGFFARLDNYLNTKTYDSKNKRKAELKEHFNKEGADKIAATTLLSVIGSGSDSFLQPVVGYLASYMPHEDGWERVRTASELVALGISGNKGLYSITRDDSNKPKVVVNYWAFLKSEETFGELYKRLEQSFPILPFVERPKVVVDNKNCGYHTFTEPLLMGNRFVKHEYPLDYATINILNGIEWELDREVLAMQEVPSKPLDTPEKLKDWKQLTADSKRLYKLLGRGKFHLAWRYDSRGRVYSNGYHLNFQSYEYKKALLNFRKKELLTD